MLTINEKDREKRKELLKKIKDEVAALKNSPLYKYRVKPVIGEGDHFAKIMFIGEAPGKNESEIGRPFCGAAGRVLDELLSSVGLKREEVYITNIVKDRPPENRDPLPEEIDLYAPFLDRQIDIIQPHVVATLGRFSMAYIMNRFGLQDQLKNISQMHGKVFETNSNYGKINIVPLFHPAVALYNGSTKETLKEDFKVLKNLI
ncbi:MAG: Thermostable uracil-DNA glycosylase [Parcubacteria group bacterium GW2011_GWA2_39_18]|nr:MAG: Thermostable uracil-DNA glycosylase [Parcubacteria group bacterium GW2011_GWA2_39_18]